jgi:hypothetical protein
MLSERFHGCSLDLAPLLLLDMAILRGPGIGAMGGRGLEPRTSCL